MKTATKTILFITVLFQGCLLWKKTSTLPNVSNVELWLASYDFQESRSDGTLCQGVQDGFYAFNNQQCSREFYACSGAAQYNLTCKSPLVFDPTFKSCAINCNIPTQPTTKNPFACEKDGNFAFGECLSSYYTCIDQQLYPQTCRGGGVFDSACKQCRSSSCCIPGETVCHSCTVTGGTTPSFTTLSTGSTGISLVTSTASPPVKDSTTAASTTTSAGALASTTPTGFPTPMTTAPFECRAYGTFAITDYCGPWYFSCVGEGTEPILMQCPQPADRIIYYDCITKECILKDSATCENLGTNACP